MDKHADCAAVNVNFWISPDKANCRPDSGGLEVFKAEAPLSWDFRRYNNRQDAIDQFLDAEGRDSMIIPHRSNRAVIFNSNLFHKTDDCRFRSGYINRRTNITVCCSATATIVSPSRPPLLYTARHEREFTGTGACDRRRSGGLRGGLADCRAWHSRGAL
ncbi:MAG: hypothetical protein VCD31_05400 [Alphaproteobacteria bacterium]